MADVAQHAQRRKYIGHSDLVKRHIPTRWSHLLGYSGVGALVRAENVLFTVMDISYWTDKQGEPAGEPLWYVELLRATLGLDDKALRQPPMAHLSEKDMVDGICVPAVRFPAWTRCPACGLLHHRPWDSRRDGEAAEDQDPRCLRCESQPRLRQVDWVLVHPEGGLQEVPWHFLAHPTAEEAQQCRKTNPNAELFLQRDPTTGRWQLQCRTCRKRASTFLPGQPLLNGRYTRLQPWQKREAGHGIPSKLPFSILEVSDPRLYLPTVQSALAVIPPECQIERGSVLDRLYRNSAARRKFDRFREGRPRLSLLMELSDEFGCTEGQVEEALAEIEKGWPLYGQTATRGQLPEKEYHALTVPIPDQHEGADFITEHRTDGLRSLPIHDKRANRAAAVRSAVNQLVAVRRLREVRIFRGFSRIEQGFDDGLHPNTEERSAALRSGWLPADLDNSKDWLPAIELYGEGIFFSLNEVILRRWQCQEGLAQRAETMDQRFRRAGLRLVNEPPLPITPRFLLLHTLAHLMIRRLEAEAGYPAASIRERVYCAEGDAPMAGILAYVAVPDLAGSLGGLEELAVPSRFLRLLAGVFDHADWCSLDPVCAEHEGQGPSQLNRAACHACTLLPEPSCQFGNLLLDRVFIAGDLNGAIRPLLDFAGED